MKNMVMVLVYWVLVGTGTVASGSELLGTGDKITIQSFEGEPIVSGGVAFRDTERSEYVLRIEADGARNFLAKDGSIHHGNSNNHTTLVWKGEPIPEPKRFIRLPPGGNLQPGMEWDASVVGGTSCGDMAFEYKAKSSQGEPFTLQIDGVSRSVKTIRIEYRASVRVCTSPNSLSPTKFWERKQVALYSPELDEFLASETISFNWRNSGADEKNRFVDRAKGWRIVEIITKK